MDDGQSLAPLRQALSGNSALDLLPGSRAFALTVRGERGAGGKKDSMTTESPEPLKIDALLRNVPQSRGERWNTLKIFFNGWFGPLGPADGYDEQSILAAANRLKLAFPPSLREWYALAGRRADVWSHQDHFLSPEELRIEDERLVIYVENQSVVSWAIPLEDMTHDDPPVFVSDPQDSEDWIEESPAVSMFALSQMLLNVKFAESTLYSANGEATRGSMIAIRRNYERLGLPDLNWPPGPTRIYGGQDLVIETNGESWIWVSGRSFATFSDAVDRIARAGVMWTQITED